MNFIDNFLHNSRLFTHDVHQCERIRTKPAWYRDCVLKLEHYTDHDTGWDLNEYLLSEACHLPEPGQNYFLSLLVGSGGGHELEADFGAGRYQRPNEPGRIVFGDEKTVRRLQGIGPYHSIAIYIRQETFRAQAEQLLQGEMPSLEPLVSKCLRDPALEILIHRLRDCFRNPENSHHTPKDLEEDILRRLLTLADSKVPSVQEGDSLRPDSIQRVIDYMQQHPDRELKRDDLAAVAGVVPGHFTRLFRQTMGESPKRFHQAIRIEHISRLLQKVHREVSISALAQQCGFSSPSHFGSEFKRQIGISPESYRAFFAQDAAKY